MAEPIPIACSLDADRYAARLEAVRALGGTALLRTERHVEGVGVHLYFRASSDIHRQLREIIRAEAECCAFLDMGLDADDGMLRLSISAPADAEPIVHDLVRSFESRPAGTLS